MKGGYEARYGDRVGGIVDIQGKDGTLLKPTFTFSINSITVNSMVQLPVSKKSSLLAAYRQTYHQLYDPTRISIVAREEIPDHGSGSGQGNSHGGGFSTNRLTDVKPDFVFRDANLKYTFKGDNGSRFSLSLYGGGDDFSYDTDARLTRFLWTREEQEKNNQLGGSAQLNYPWSNGDATNLTIAYSAFERQLYRKAQTESSQDGTIKILNHLDSENTVDEMSFNAEHTLNFHQGHRLLIGTGVINNKVELSRFSLDEQQIDINNESPRIYSYLQDEYPFGELLELKTGVRIVYNTKPGNWYVEPRVSASFSVFDDMKINASWGLYNQFISKTTVLDSTNNYTEFWTNSNDEQIPVLSAEHFVAGLSYQKNGFTASAEAFYKTTDGLSRYVNGNLLVSQGFYEGKSRSKGLDLFIKKEYKRNMAWISYTLSNTEEQFPYFRINTWRPAPHQQKHELKFAGVYNYKSFYLSANYVYGSGFERYDFEVDNDLNFDKAYSRLDAALVYKFKPGKVKAEAGISVLNILNTENIKYSNIRISTIDEVSLVGVYSDAISFTPALFLNIEF